MSAFCQPGLRSLLLRLSGLLLLLSVGGSLLSAQQTITLRLVDYETGLPIKNARVRAVWWNGTIPSNGVITPAVQKVVARLSTRTGNDGTIALSVPTPSPEHLEVSSPFDTVDGLDTQLSVAQVLASGICVIADADHSPDAKTLRDRQAPGEVLVFTRKLTARDRVP